MAKKQKQPRQIPAAWLEAKYTRLILAQTQKRDSMGVPALLLPTIPSKEAAILLRRKLRWTILACALCRKENGEAYVDTYVLSTGKERVLLKDISDYGKSLVDKACAEATQSHVIQSGYVAYLGSYEMAAQRLVDVFEALDGFEGKANWEREFPINYRTVETISEHITEI